MKKPNKRCLECAKLFYKPKCLDRIKFCCDKCYRENRKRWKLSDEWKKNISEGVKKNLPSTAYKKEQRPSKATEFKKGEHLEEEHPKWNGGKYVYGAIVKRSDKEWICESCKETEKLCVHHIDKNRQNNKLENLMIVCWKCHARIHRILKKDGNHKKRTEQCKLIKGKVQ